ncbi:hypothetical protein SRCM101060_02830 [Lactiplantibacillus plantarum]|nr:hypothetical protein Lp16_0382 [Lactiplantibacillus plantarum 16]MCG0557344.1 hypothetical protein [Lactiplantibacillus plantarum]MCG0650580.1 hypothetical protein [Lactiplantibacillus plantarum]MCG0817262.1 hypothetical protein [Lactiplantibacillus plantarum]MCG0820277.1 hypothetical protein [Lactiplantibacillus plantarum]
MVIGYTQVSKNGQKLNHQIDQLLTYGDNDPNSTSYYH